MILVNGDELNSRAISILQHNIQKEQNFFDISKCIYSFDVENEFESNNIFNKLVFLDTNEAMRQKYKRPVNAYASY